MTGREEVRRVMNDSLRETDGVFAWDLFGEAAFDETPDPATLWGLATPAVRVVCGRLAGVVETRLTLAAFRFGAAWRLVGCLRFDWFIYVGSLVVSRSCLSA